MWDPAIRGQRCQFVTDDQSMAIMLNKYFSSVFNTFLIGDINNSNDIITIAVTGSASVVGSQNVTIKLSDNSKCSFRNNNENLYLFYQQNCTNMQ